jgi:hypothetical protein
LLRIISGVWRDLRRRLKGIMDPLPEVAVDKQLLT